MKKIIFLYLPVSILMVAFSGCLKPNDYFEDFASTQPIADIPKAPANTVTVSTIATNSWKVLDSTAAGVDYATAVHLSAKDHVGDVTLHMKIDVAAAQKFIARVPFFVQNFTLPGGTVVKDTVYYAVITEDLYTVNSSDVTISNAGVFSTGDFMVHIKTGTLAPDGQDIFKHTYYNKHFAYILPITIESAAGGQYTVASNFQTILWYIRVK